MPQVIELKVAELNSAIAFYRYMSDYIYDIVFEYETTMNDEGKLAAVVPAFECAAAQADGGARTARHMQSRLSTQRTR